MSTSDRGSERGIDPTADYGTQFLNARKGEPEGPPPPPPPTTEGSEGGAGGRGKMVLVAVIVVALLGGAAAVFALSGGDDEGDTGDDLITASGRVEVDDEGRPIATTTTTTEKPEPTTTEAPETTTTQAPTTLAPTTPPPTLPTVTTLPVATLPPGYPTLTTLPGGGPLPTTPVPTAPQTTAGPTCPGGSVSTRVNGAFVTIAGGQYKVEVDGTTVNDTTAAINFEVTVPVTYKPGGSSKTDNVRPDQYGQSVRAGGSLDWTLTYLVNSENTPTIGSPSGSWSWTDAALRSCPTSAFG
jgi:hypothetical protein